MTKITKFRKDLNLTQVEFWRKVGVVQSTGCRYESGKHIPEPVKMLLKTVYGWSQS